VFGDTAAVQGHACSRTIQQNLAWEGNLAPITENSECVENVAPPSFPKICLLCRICGLNDSGRATYMLASGGRVATYNACKERKGLTFGLCSEFGNL